MQERDVAGDRGGDPVTDPSNGCRQARHTSGDVFAPVGGCFRARAAGDCDGGAEASGESVTHAYDQSGRYNVFVSVTGSDDSAGSSDEARVTIGKPPAGTT